MDVEKKRLSVIILFGLVAIPAALMLTEPTVSPPQPVSNETIAPSSIPSNAVINSTTPILPKGATHAGLTVRDIFSPPAEYEARMSSPTRGALPGGGGRQGFSAGPAPRLTGVIAGEGTRVAILRQGATSHSYRVGQSAGAYRVAAIGSGSVTLAGPDGTLVIKMGQ